MSSMGGRLLAVLGCGVLAGGLIFFFPHRSEKRILLMETNRSSETPTRNSADGGTPATSLPSNNPQSPPFIISDTTTDSPGTNLVTRIVTFSARIDGAAPLVQQWKVDKGSGFIAVCVNATNWMLVISNAQVSDSGSYALFATNKAGGTNTTPIPLVIVEAAD